MILLIAGLALFAFSHLFKRLAPAPRGRIGDAGKGIVAIASLAGVALMVTGYRGSEGLDLWSAPAWLRHVNNLMMLLAVYLFVASGLRTRITRAIRHPQLTAVKTWAVAHLLVNSDPASLVLFGGMLVWSVAVVVSINRATPRPAPNPPAAAGTELAALAIALVLTAGIGWVHGWLGYPPFG